MESPTKPYNPRAKNQSSYSELLRNQLSKAKGESYKPYPDHLSEYKPLRVSNVVFIPAKQQPLAQKQVKQPIHLFVRIQTYMNNLRAIIRQRAIQIYHAIYKPWIKKTNH